MKDNTYNEGDMVRYYEGSMGYTVCEVRATPFSEWVDVASMTPREWSRFCVERQEWIDEIFVDKWTAKMEDLAREYGYTPYSWSHDLFEGVIPGMGMCFAADDDDPDHYIANLARIVKSFPREAPTPRTVWVRGKRYVMIGPLPPRGEGGQ